MAARTGKNQRNQSIRLDKRTDSQGENLAPNRGLFSFRQYPKRDGYSAKRITKTPLVDIQFFLKFAHVGMHAVALAFGYKIMYDSRCIAAGLVDRTDDIGYVIPKIYV